MERKSTPYDFRIIFNITLCKMICRIRFSTYFWPPDKIDGIMAVFLWKKVDKIENYMNGGMVKESPPYDFLIIFNATSCKMIRRIRFFIYFWPPDKIDGNMAVIL